MLAHGPRQTSLQVNPTLTGQGSIGVRYCGFFQELEHGRPNGGSLAANVQLKPELFEDQVLGYLKSGNLLVGSPGIGCDVLSEDGSFSGPYHILTDGSWAWPQDLAFYVEKYHVKLPKEFVEDMRAKNWACPLLSEAQIQELGRKIQGRPPGEAS